MRSVRNCAAGWSRESRDVLHRCQYRGTDGEGRSAAARCHNGQGDGSSGTPLRGPSGTTDFGAASIRALPYAVSFANRVGPKLILLHVIAPVAVGLHRLTGDDVMQTEELARQNGLRRLRELVGNKELTVVPEFIVAFGSPAEKILQVADSFTADIIIMGLHRSAHIGTASHMLWTTAYEVARRAGCPVMTAISARAAS